MGTHSVTASRGIEDGEIDIGIGVGRVEKATKANRVRGFPEFENLIDIDEVIEKAAVFVPALAGAYRTQDGDKGRKISVDRFELSPEERTG